VAVELKVPAVGESVTEVQIGDWLKKEGDFVKADEAILMIETDKVTVELPAPAAGKIVKVLVKSGSSAKVGDVVGMLEPGEAGKAADSKPSDRPAAATPAAPAPASNPPPKPRVPVAPVMPAAARALHQAGLTAEQVTGSGPGGRVLKEDVERAVAAQASGAHAPAPGTPGFREEEIVPMTTMRRRIAERLVEAQQTAAMLTTFNEVDMSAAMELRKKHQDAFLAKYDIKLGFMSFFVKAAVDALKLFPAVNSEIREKNIVYRNYCDIGVAVGGGKGLVVPIIRNAERLGFADVEKVIKDFGTRAQKNAIKLEELQGGTFTITNGGVYGSLLSTPILNPPQSGILGLHGIQERPIALNGQVVIRPMMYIALTYDHRVVDGREAVTFLRRIKESVEEPTRLLLEV
jgi:2-oxoglutarate dehydrogenase E2 component (dihydrolipoamide succinyltransferase)